MPPPPRAGRPPANFFTPKITKDLSRWAAELQGGAGRVEDAVSRAVWDAADELLAAAQEEAPVDRGGLRYSGSVRYGPGPRAEVTFKAPHAKPVEFGSRPHMPPVGPIKEWVLRTGRVRRGELRIKPGSKPYGRKPREEEAEDVAWAIARKIAKEGQEPDPFLQRALGRVVGRLGPLIRGRLTGRVLR